jgi:hypothetical protein
MPFMCPNIHDIVSEKTKNLGIHSSQIYISLEYTLCGAQEAWKKKPSYELSFSMSLNMTWAEVLTELAENQC